MQETEHRYAAYFHVARSTPRFRTGLVTDSRYAAAMLVTGSRYAATMLYSILDKKCGNGIITC